jgi:hypothetical protein
MCLTISCNIVLRDVSVYQLQLGYVINALWGFIAIFIWLWIFDQNVISLGVTWVSFMVAFSFMFGSSASNFVEASVIYVQRTISAIKHLDI